MVYRFILTKRVLHSFYKMLIHGLDLKSDETSRDLVIKKSIPKPYPVVPHQVAERLAVGVSPFVSALPVAASRGDPVFVSPMVVAVYLVAMLSVCSHGCIGNAAISLTKLVPGSKH